MSPTPADLRYARYMLDWIDELEWPPFMLAEAELPALRAHWREQEETDLDAIAERLWVWVDANEAEALPRDHRMILARMLLCVAAPENRALQQRGYFEDLLRLHGVPEEQIQARLPMDAVVVDAAVDAGTQAASASPVEATPAAGNTLAARLQRAKSHVLMAYCAGSFVSGSAANPDPALSPAEVFWVITLAGLIWLWYRLDSAQRQFPRSPGMTAAVVLVAAIGIPWYLIRSRGWPQAQSALLQALALFVCSAVLAAVGAAMLGDLGPAALPPAG